MIDDPEGRPTLERVLSAVSRPALRRLLLHRVRPEYEGLEHIPETGPFILVANHSSFLDHFLLWLPIWAGRAEGVHFLTKQESFDTTLKAAWHRSSGAIPIDRDEIKPSSVREVLGVLREGGIVGIYPEGTRGPGWPLHPFKPGAFHFAIREGVPIIPVGIFGANDVLPKGATWPRKATARVVFGPALPQFTELPRKDRVDALAEAAEIAVIDLVLMARTTTPQRRAHAAHTARRLANCIVDDLVSRPDVPPTREAVARIQAHLRLAEILDGNDDVQAEVVRLRVQGFRATHGKRLRRLLVAYPLRSRARRVVRQRDLDPQIAAMAHYILARWYLKFPDALGGQSDSGTLHMRCAAALSGDDTRYLMGLAEAYVATGDRKSARNVLTQVMDASASDERAQRRLGRARDLDAVIATATRAA
jgi:1-acyl-sn-glycerol-3-phosphate acyltransferase